MLKFILLATLATNRAIAISKHLMLKFIVFCNVIPASPDNISKHLMLKFIPMLSWCPQTGFYFKTSYVEVYPLRLPHPVCRAGISKHLMLKFIIHYYHQVPNFFLFQNILCWSLSNERTGIWRYPIQFQNILCWSLSSDSTCSLSMLSNFKTSYVEVYRPQRTLPMFAGLFQNILCWSLSLYPCNSRCL